MKTKILLLFLIWSGVVWGQEQYKVGQIIIFNTYTKHSLTNDYKKLLKNESVLDTINFNPILIEPDIKFKIVSIDDNNVSVIVRSLDKMKGKKNVRDKSYYYNDRIFNVDKKEFLTKADASVSDLPDRFSIGILTLPFKYRPQEEKTFEAQFNLNSTLNVLLIHNFWGSGTNFYAQIGAGLGSVELNSNNSYGVGLDENINAATLTAFGGVMLQYKKVQAGFYFGCDQINNQNHYQWRNNGNIWRGFGIGYQLFNIGLGEAKANSIDKK
jgi:hypothetical protein